MMSTKTKVDALWEEFRKAIDATYTDGQTAARMSGSAMDEANVLRDYVRDMTWHDDLEKLLAREMENERQHRRGETAPKDFSVITASRLILMNCASKGAKRDAMPSATEFLVLRQTAVEAEVIGWLVRDHLDAVWHETLETLDYPKLMQVSA